VDWHNHELASWIRDARVESKVILLGEQTDMHGFFAGIDIGSSSSETEAFPLAVGEAMSTGTVCVVTNVGDSASIVGDTGSVVPAGDPDALAAAWKALLATGPHNLRRLGSMARRRIEAKYSLEAVARSYERAYLSARQIYLPQRCLRNRRDDRKCPSVGSI
jgi:glycosyltransferase involved in cell wall biosynthesis